MEDLSSYSQYLELIALIIGIIKYKEFKDFYFKYVFYFLIYVVANEFLAGISYEVLNIPNTFLYNIYILIHFSFFLAWFHSLIVSTIKARILKFFFLVYIVFWFGEALTIGSITDNYLSITFSLGTLLLIIAVAFYFIEMLTREVVLNITQSPYFWVCFGILTYCVTYLPFYITLMFFLQENPVILSVVLFLINCIQYCCIAIAFIKSDRYQMEHPIAKKS